MESPEMEGVQEWPQVPETHLCGFHLPSVWFMV